MAGWWGRRYRLRFVGQAHLAGRRHAVRSRGRQQVRLVIFRRARRGEFGQRRGDRRKLRFRNRQVASGGGRRVPIGTGAMAVLADLLTEPRSSRAVSGAQRSRSAKVPLRAPGEVVEPLLPCWVRITYSQSAISVARGTCRLSIGQSRIRSARSAATQLRRIGPAANASCQFRSDTGHRLTRSFARQFLPLVELLVKGRGGGISHARTRTAQSIQQHIKAHLI